MERVRSQILRLMPKEFARKNKTETNETKERDQEGGYAGIY